MSQIKNYYVFIEILQDFESIFGNIAHYIYISFKTCLNKHFDHEIKVQFEIGVEARKT